MKELSEECKKFRKEYERRKLKTHYDAIDHEMVMTNAYKQFGCAILNTSLEDADYEFLEDDYDEWKSLFKKYEPKNKVSVMNESDFKEEYEYKTQYKKMLCDLCGIDEKLLNKSKIPQEVIDERNIFENNKIKDVKKLLNNEFGEDNLKIKASLHGWKIGKFCKEKTIFDI